MISRSAILAGVLVCVLASLSQAAPGLPWFVSDRFDVYRGGVNDVPWTFEYDWVSEGPGYLVYGFYSPAGPLWIRSDGALEYCEIAWSQDEFFSGTPGSGLLTLNSGSWLRRPFGFYAVDTLGVQEIFQAEWIEPSLQCVVDHWYAGALIGIPIDLCVLLLHALMRPVLQVLSIFGR